MLKGRAGRRSQSRHCELQGTRDQVLPGSGWGTAGVLGAGVGGYKLKAAWDTNPSLESVGLIWVLILNNLGFFLKFLERFNDLKKLLSLV